MKLHASIVIVTISSIISTSCLAGDIVSLSGTWNFRLDADKVGHAEKWFEQELTDRIKLPGSTDEAGYGTETTGPANGSLSRPFIYEGPAWYQTEFALP